MVVAHSFSIGKKFGEVPGEASSLCPIGLAGSDGPVKF